MNLTDAGAATILSTTISTAITTIVSFNNSIIFFCKHKIKLTTITQQSNQCRFTFFYWISKPESNSIINTQEC